MHLNGCDVGRGAIGLVKANGIADLSTTDLKLRVQSNLADLASVMQLFGNNHLQISGPFKLDAELAGNFKNPTFSLQAGMTYGSVYHIPFDSLTASFRFDSLTDKALVLSDFHLLQKPDLSLEVQGVLPFNDHPLDLQVLLKGNILKVLHQIEPDILVSRGASVS